MHDRIAKALAVVPMPSGKLAAGLLFAALLIIRFTNLDIRFVVFVAFDLIGCFVLFLYPLMLAMIVFTGLAFIRNDRFDTLPFHLFTGVGLGMLAGLPEARWDMTLGWWSMLIGACVGIVAGLITAYYRT